MHALFAAHVHACLDRGPVVLREQVRLRAAGTPTCVSERTSVISASGARPSGSARAAAPNHDASARGSARSASSPAHANVPVGSNQHRRGSRDLAQDRELPHAIVLGVDQPDSIRPRRAPPLYIRPCQEKRGTPAVDVKKLARTPRPRVRTARLVELVEARRHGGRQLQAPCYLAKMVRPSNGSIRAQPGT